MTRSAERSVNNVLQDETVTDVRSESPLSYDSGVRSLSSLYSAFQDTPGAGIMMDRSRRRRIHPHSRRTGSGISATRPSLQSRASSGALFSLRRDALTTLPNSAIDSPYGSFDESDDGQVGAAPSFGD